MASKNNLHIICSFFLFKETTIILRLGTYYLFTDKTILIFLKAYNVIECVNADDMTIYNEFIVLYLQFGQFRDYKQKYFITPVTIGIVGTYIVHIICFVCKIYINR